MYRDPNGRDGSHGAPGKSTLIDAPPSHATPGKTTRVEQLATPAHAGPASGGGSVLPAALRAQMEGSLGADFSAVRVHQGGQAGALGAEAYTMGDDLHFAPGKYDPASAAGRELIGHELTHVVQQREGRVAATGQARGVDLNDDPALEREADERGARAAAHDASGAAPAAAPTRAAASTAQRKVVQRRVGFEFDVESGWTISGRRPGEQADSLIKDTKEYVLLGDSKLSGLTPDNGRAEFRTKPLDSPQQVGSAIDELVALANRFKDRGPTVLADADQQYAEQQTGRDHVVIHGVGSPGAKPQATFGVRLANMEHLQHRLAELDANRRNGPALKQVLMPGNVPGETPTAAKRVGKRLLGGNIAQRAAQIAQQAGQLYDAATQRLLQAQPPAVAPQDVATHRAEVVGFVIAVLRMLYDAYDAAAEARYSQDLKYATPLMPRTDYHSMLNSLEPGARQIMVAMWGNGRGPFRTAFEQIVSDDLGAAMFPEGYRSPDDGQDHAGPNRDAWIDSAMQGSGAQGKDLMAQPPGYDRVEGMGSMGVDDLDPKKVIFEHRGTVEDGNLAPATWKEFALATYRFVEWATTPQAQQAQGQGPPGPQPPQPPPQQAQPPPQQAPQPPPQQAQVPIQPLAQALLQQLGPALQSSSGEPPNKRRRVDDP